VYNGAQRIKVIFLYNKLKPIDMKDLFKGSSISEIIMIITAILFGFCGILMIIGIGIHSKTVEGIGLFGIAGTFIVICLIMAINETSYKE
jgi:hypothetical protein